MTNPTLHGIDMGDVQGEDVDEDLGVMVLPIGLTAATGTEVFSLDGATRKITVKSIYTGSVSTLAAVVSSFQTLVNHQVVADTGYDKHAYVGVLLSNYVVIGKIGWSYSSDSILMLNMTFDLYVTKAS